MTAMLQRIVQIFPPISGGIPPEGAEAPSGKQRIIRGDYCSTQ